MQPLDLDLVSTKSKVVKPGAKLDGTKALTVLNTLPVKGKAPATGYNRNTKFGNGWKDFDKDKCDERQEALSRDMSKVKFKDKKKCTVASGTLNDLYTGRQINWKVKSGSVDIDHVVALKNAWISGGQQLSQAQRQALANDPLNLIAADASANRQKGDKNAAEWLPKNKSFRCQYVATQISVKKKYALSVTSAEKKAMSKVLNSCKNQKAAKVTPIKPAGSSKSTTSSKPKAPGTVKVTVSPGAFCKGADKGKKGKSKAGKTYTCKSSKSESRLRWRT
ncbi:HNH endonuclease family protein [Glutamicibacter protophormiae]